jgi:hypothetical protein
MASPAPSAPAVLQASDLETCFCLHACISAPAVQILLCARIPGRSLPRSSHHRPHSCF